MMQMFIRRKVQNNRDDVSVPPPEHGSMNCDEYIDIMRA